GRRGRSEQGREDVTWNIGFPVAGDRWNLIVNVRERALMQIRDAAGPVALVLPESRRVPIRMNPGLSPAEFDQVSAYVRLVPKDVTDLELFVRAEESFRSGEATVPLLASGPNALVLTL